MSDERNQTLYLSAWAATGVFMRMYSLALQRRPVLQGPITHIAHAAVAVGIGAAFNSYRERQLVRLEAQKNNLLERRKMKEEAA